MLSEPSDDEVIEKFCYEESTANCDTCGGLYTWTEAISANAASSSSTLVGASPHLGACPLGWHVPTQSEWSTLLRVADAMDATDGNEGMTLRSSAEGSWASLDGVGGPGTDDYGFTALAGRGLFVSGQTCKAGTNATDAYDYCWGRRFAGYSGQATTTPTRQLCTILETTCLAWLGIRKPRSMAIPCAALRIDQARFPIPLGFVP